VTTHRGGAPTIEGVTTAPASPTPPPELARLRGSIDNIDAALIHLLAERFKATQQVGVLKARLGLPASDPGREAQQVGRLRSLAHDADLDPVFAEKFLAFIVEEVIRHHEAIAAGPDGQGASGDADGTPATA
jgi:chorismate mutase